MLLASRATNHIELKIFCLIQIHLSIGATMAIQLCNESNVKSKSTYYTGTTTNSNSMYIENSGTEGLVGFCSLSTQSVHASQLVTSSHALRRRHLAVQHIMLRPYPHLKYPATPPRAIDAPAPSTVQYA